MSEPASDPRPPIDERTLYITSQGTQLGVRDNQFVVRDVNEQDGEASTAGPLARYPVEKIETINVLGRGIDVTSGALATCTQTETTLNFFSIHGRFRGRFTPAGTSVAILHRQQHEVDERTQQAIASRFVAGKILNGRRYLERKGVDVPPDTPLETAFERLPGTKTLDEIRGIEGEAARWYFGVYDQTLADGWSMAGRSRRPPDDRVNSLLSLTYTFLQQECEAALRQVNLDPYVGLFHRMRHGRPALALDLLEEFRRAFADPFVARLINRGTIARDDFTDELELRDACFDRYLEKFEAYMTGELSHERLERTLTRREVIRLQANLLRKRITNELDRYPPFEATR